MTEREIALQEREKLYLALENSYRSVGEGAAQVRYQCELSKLNDRLARLAA